MSVTPISHDMARMFVIDYCDQWEIPFDPIRFASASWWGAYEGHITRAVMGLEVMPNKSIFVEGFYSSEDRQGKRGLKALLAFLDTIRAPLFATIHYKNQEMIDFALSSLNKRHRQWETTALVIHSPFNEPAEMRSVQLSAERSSDALGRPPAAEGTGVPDAVL